uniref:Uncharacterized protein n=1 Tax=Anguilla anguilla TaxID=7936 RepID=A0A0E9THQ8_ANGAN
MKQNTKRHKSTGFVYRYIKHKTVSSDIKKNLINTGALWRPEVDWGEGDYAFILALIML